MGRVGTDKTDKSPPLAFPYSAPVAVPVPDTCKKDLHTLYSFAIVQLSAATDKQREGKQMKNDLPIQARAEQRNAETAATFAAQKPARNIEQERAYRAKCDAIHAEAAALLRARGR